MLGIFHNNMTYIVNKIKSLFLAMLVTLILTENVYADLYGQESVILGDSAQTEIVHTAIDAGITDSIVLIGALFMVFSAFMYLLYNRINKVQI